MWKTTIVDSSSIQHVLEEIPSQIKIVIKFKLRYKKKKNNNNKKHTNAERSHEIQLS